MPDDNEKFIEIFTDGACVNNPGVGGWACILKWGEHTKTLSGSSMDTTNNKMELEAVIQGLQAVKRAVPIYVYTDSKYVVNAFNKGWLINWKTNGWVNASSAPVKNQDRWKKLDALVDKYDVVFQWVKGHSGNRFNEMADRAATKAAWDAKKGRN